MDKVYVFSNAQVYWMIGVGATIDVVLYSIAAWHLYKLWKRTRR